MNLHSEKTSKYKSSEKAFVILMVLVWTKSTILSFIAVYLRSVPVLEILADSSITIGIIVSAIVALPFFSRRVNVGDVFFFVLLLGIVFGSLWLLDENSEYINEDLTRMLWQVFPLYFLGLAYSHDLCKKALMYASMVGVVTCFAYQMYQLNLGRDLALDNMDSSYKVLPSILFLVLCVFEYKKLWAIPFIILGGILLLSYGTRGPMLVLFVFLGYYAISYVFRKGSFILKLLAVFLIGFALYCMIFDNVLSDIAEYLKLKFEEMGFSTRIFDFFIEDDIANDTGREKLYDEVKAGIAAKPIFGYGLMGDRVLLDGRYVHNIAYELMTHYGVIFGIAILAFIAITPVRALIRTKEPDKRSLILMFMFLVFIKLWVTGSYLHEMFLFFLLGLSVSAIRKR